MAFPSFPFIFSCSLSTGSFLSACCFLFSPLKKLSWVHFLQSSYYSNSSLPFVANLFEWVASVCCLPLLPSYFLLTHCDRAFVSTLNWNSSWQDMSDFLLAKSSDQFLLLILLDIMWHWIHATCFSWFSCYFTQYSVSLHVPPLFLTSEIQCSMSQSLVSFLHLFSMWYHPALDLNIIYTNNTQS